MAIQYLATNRKVGNGTTQVWDFSFAGARPDANNGTEPYLDSDDIRVATVEITSEGDEIRDPILFELGPGPSQVTINPALESGQDFVIFRATDSEVPIADFVDFSSISEQDLDNGFRQTLYVVQELQDRVADSNANSVNAVGIANVAAAVAGGAEQDSAAALALATTANSNANQAHTNAASALAAADGAVTAAGQATNTANTALGAANQAQSDVAGAVATANTANSNASTALSTANAASTAASGATSTANTALSVANTASVASQEALGTANTAIALADDADGKADQALEAAGLIVGFQEQLDDITATVQDLTGEDIGAISLNTDNLEFLTDMVAARNNLEVFSKTETHVVVAGSVSAVQEALALHKNSSDHDRRYLRRSKNLTDLSDTSVARDNLGLGSAATKDAGSETGQLAEITSLGVVGAGLNVLKWSTVNGDDCDDHIASRWLLKSNSSPNKPLDFSMFFLWASGERNGSCTQEAIEYGGSSDFPRKAMRKMGGGVWNEWCEHLTTANQIELGTTQTSARAALGIEGTVPFGFIGMWSGAASAIPEGWALCDGTNGTPDLRGRFIIGAGDSYDVGDTGGSESVTLTEAQLPAHNHTMTSAGDHQHTDNWTDGNGGHNHSGSTWGGGNHNHSTEYMLHGSHAYGYEDRKPYGGHAYSDNRNSIDTTYVGDHTHTIPDEPNHAHSFTTTSDGAHTHTINNTGSGSSHENRPPYYALAFIMKLED